MAHDPLAAVQQLQYVVARLAPSLCPQVLPRGSSYGLDMILSLCKTVKQRQELLSLVQSSKPNGLKALSTSLDEEEEEETDHEEKDRRTLQPQVIGTFDVANRVFAVQKVQWMHEQDALVHEFARFMEVQMENPVAATDVVQHFLKINGHEVDKVLLAQQCFSAAFALQTLLRAFPQVPIAVDGQVVEMTEASDVAEVFAPLFASKAKKTKKKNTSQANAKASQVQEHATRRKSKHQKATKRKTLM